MSVVKPCIDDLLEKTDHNRFLLASLASKRACDINSMLRGQHNRVLAVQDVDDITIGLSGADTISMAMDEIVHLHAVGTETRHFEREVPLRLLHLTREHDQIGGVFKRSAIEHGEFAQQLARRFGVGANE